MATIVGTDTKKRFVDGQGTSAQFDYPAQMTIDKNDNPYVIDPRISQYGGSSI
jgi:hypothetical protein